MQSQEGSNILNQKYLPSHNMGGGGGSIILNTCMTIEKSKCRDMSGCRYPYNYFCVLFGIARCLPLNVSSLLCPDYIASYPIPGSLLHIIRNN